MIRSVLRVKLDPRDIYFYPSLSQITDLFSRSPLSYINYFLNKLLGSTHGSLGKITSNMGNMKMSDTG